MAARGQWRAGLALLVDLLLIAVAAGLAARRLTEPGFPFNHDGEFHLFRLVDYYRLLRQGDWYPRWAPTIAGGFGYPVPNFYAPLSLWIAAALRLTGLSAVAALKAAYAGSIFVAGWGMYAYARCAWGRAGGLVAGVAYATLPYLLIDVYIRGSYAEAWAIAVLPIAFLGARYLATVAGARAVGVGGLAFGLLILTHNITAMLALPFLAIFVLLFRQPRTTLRNAGNDRREPPATALLRLAVALVIGLGLSTIYWLPAIGELRFVSTNLILRDHFDYHNHFRPLLSLIQSSIMFDHTTVDDFHAGLVQTLVAMAGVIAGLAVTRLRRSALYFAAMLLVSLLMQTSGSAVVWETVPFFSYVQFPYRWLTLTGLASACLAGIGGTALHGFIASRQSWPLAMRHAVSVGTLGGLVALLCVTSVVSLQPLTIVAQGEEVTTSVMREVERFRLEIAAKTSGEYLPRTNSLHPLWYTRLGEAPDDAPRPIDAAVRAAGANRLTLTANSTEPGPLVIDQLYFPGWQAWIDGVPSPVEPFGELGLVSVQVPSGQHQVEFAYGRTMLQRIATAVTIATVVLLAAGLAWTGIRTDSRGQVLSVGGAALILIGVGVVSLPPAPSAVYELRARFGNGAQLGGWRPQPAQEAEASGITSVDLYWTTASLLSGDFTVALRVLDDNGNVVGLRDQVPGNGLRPPRLWIPALVIHDEQQLRLLPGVPGGRYRLVASLRVGNEWIPVVDGPRVTWREATGHEVTGVPLGEVDLRAAVPRQTPDLQNTAGVVFGNAVELVGWEVVAPVAGPGRVADVKPDETIQVRLKWRGRTGIGDATVFNHLHDHAFSLLTQDDNRPRRGYTPLALLQWGDEVIDDFTLRVPKDAAPGRYTLSVGLYKPPEITNLPITEGPTTGDRYVLGTVKVHPSANRTASPNEHPVDATIGGRARLMGVTVEPDEPPTGGETVRVTLRWQAIGGPWPDATVFVHLLDASGTLVAQHDGQPMGGAFPLSIWDDGDVILDVHEVTVPVDTAGPYRLAVGLYDPSTGERFELDNGRDEVLLDWPTHRTE